MGKKIYVGNLNYAVTDSVLAETFGAYGTVDSAKVITDRDTNRSKGFGFVEMSTEDECAQAIENLNGTELEGRQMNVNEAKPREPRSGGFGGGGGGNRGGGGFGGGGRGRF